MPHPKNAPTNSVHVAGEWIPALSGATVPVVEAATGEPLGSIADALEADIDRAVEAARRAGPAWAATDPGERTTAMDPMVTDRHRARVESYIDAGRAAGARVATGGGRPAGLDRGWFVEPTVFAGVADDMTVAREEIFGPVVCVLPYDSEDEAVAIANGSDYGLAGSVWSEDAEHALAVAGRVQTGSIGVNMWTADPAGPFGGWKASGLGKELGPEGLVPYLRARTVHVPS